jgi:hypothetical protein
MNAEKFLTKSAVQHPVFMSDAIAMLYIQSLCNGHKKSVKAGFCGALLLEAN